jgi:predicted dehydrogenase
VLRIGVLGTARITERALLRAAVRVPGVTVTAVAARDLNRAQAYAGRHGIAAAYGSYDELLADPAIDAIYNPLPNSLHGPWTLQAITAGKHVLCEKPFAANAAEAALVADAAAASGLVVMEAMHYRYHPLIARLARLVHELGGPRHIQCWTGFVIADPGDIRWDYALSGGALMDGGCYAIDCIRMLAGGELSVTAALADTGPGSGGLADHATAARLELAGGGVTAYFDSAFTPGGEFLADVHVTCQDGTVTVRNFILAHEGHLTATRGAEVVADEAGDPETTYACQLRAFAAAIQAGQQPVTSAAQAVTTMRLIDDVYRAAGLPPR